MKFFNDEFYSSVIDRTVRFESDSRLRTARTVLTGRKRNGCTCKQLRRITSEGCPCNEPVSLFNPLKLSQIMALSRPIHRRRPASGVFSLISIHVRWFLSPVLRQNPPAFSASRLPFFQHSSTRWHYRGSRSTLEFMKLKITFSVSSFPFSRRQSETRGDTFSADEKWNLKYARNVSAKVRLTFSRFNCLMKMFVILSEKRKITFLRN